MSHEETNTIYKCSVHGYHTLHKWDTGVPDSRVIELQEMVVDRQDDVTGTYRVPFLFEMMWWVRTEFRHKFSQGRDSVC